MMGGRSVLFFALVALVSLYVVSAESYQSWVLDALNLQVASSDADYDYLIKNNHLLERMRMNPASRHLDEAFYVQDGEEARALSIADGFAKVFGDPVNLNIVAGWVTAFVTGFVVIFGLILREAYFVY